MDVVNGTNATFSLNAVALPSQNRAARPAGTVLTVTLTGAPTVVTAGTTPGLQFPATITNSTGLDDAAGNRISVTTGERVLDVAANTTPLVVLRNLILAVAAKMTRSADDRDAPPSSRRVEDK